MQITTEKILVYENNETLNHWLQVSVYFYFISFYNVNTMHYFIPSVLSRQ